MQAVDYLNDTIILKRGVLTIGAFHKNPYKDTQIAITFAKEDFNTTLFMSKEEAQKLSNSLSNLIHELSL